VAKSQGYKVQVKEHSFSCHLLQNRLNTFVLGFRVICLVYDETCISYKFTFLDHLSATLCPSCSSHGMHQQLCCN